MMRFLRCLIIMLLLPSCTDEVTVRYSSFEWLFFNKEEAKTKPWSKMIVGRYLFQIIDDQIFVREKFVDGYKTHVLNVGGKLINTFSGESIYFDTFKILEYGKALNDNRFSPLVQVPLKDTTVISYMTLEDKLLKLGLLNRETVREKRIELIYRGEKRTVIIPDNIAYFFYDIKQFDDTRFILSFRGRIEDVSMKSINYSGMIDFERVLN